MTKVDTVKTVDVPFTVVVLRYVDVVTVIGEVTVVTFNEVVNPAEDTVAEGKDLGIDIVVDTYPLGVIVVALGRDVTDELTVTGAVVGVTVDLTNVVNVKTVDVPLTSVVVSKVDLEKVVDGVTKLVLVGTDVVGETEETNEETLVDVVGT